MGGGEVVNSMMGKSESFSACDGNIDVMKGQRWRINIEVDG